MSRPIQKITKAKKGCGHGKWWSTCPASVRPFTHIPVLQKEKKEKKNHLVAGLL
jgi:hypothetical protein